MHRTPRIIKHHSSSTTDTLSAGGKRKQVMNTQAPDELSPWRSDTLSEDGEPRESSIDGLPQEHLAQKPFRYNTLPPERAVTGTNNQLAIRLQSPRMMGTSDLFTAQPGQISHLPVSRMTLIVTGGHSDPRRGPNQLFTPEYGEWWLFGSGDCSVPIVAHDSSVIIHWPDWLNEGTIPEVREAFGPVDVCMINQTTVMDRICNLRPAYRLIKVRNEDHIGTKMLRDACRGISSISVMLWVRPRHPYNPKVEEDIASICERRGLHYYIDESDDKVVMY